MRQTRLEANFAELGIIKDDLDSSHSIVGMLSASEETPPYVRMPYLADGFFGPAAGADQFRRINEWFSSDKFPTHLSFDAGELQVQLFGCRFSSRRESMDGEATSMATMTPEVTVVSSERNQPEGPLLFHELSSAIDGVRQWSALQSLSWKPELDDHGKVRAFSMTARTMEPTTWRTEFADLSFDIEWRGKPSVTQASVALPTTGQAMIETSVWLSTAFEEPQPIEVHLQKQRDLMALLVLVYGAPIRIRQHRTSDDRFGAKSHVVYSRTWHQHHEQLRHVDGYKDPIFQLDDIGTDGLERWYSKDTRWQRAVTPLYGLLQRDGFGVEDVAIAALISLEASGQLVGEDQDLPAGLRGIAAHVYRSLSHLELDWTTMPFDQVRLSRALATNYNDVKHFDRGDFPDPEVTNVLGSFALHVARYVALTAASKDAVLNHLQLSSQSFRRATNRLKNLNIDEYGRTTSGD